MIFRVPEKRLIPGKPFELVPADMNLRPMLTIVSRHEANERYEMNG